MSNINTRHRLSFRTTPALKRLITAIADIEGVTLGDVIHTLYKDKLELLHEELELPVIAMTEIELHFDEILTLDV
jgi:uncharacterized protein (DUF1778 family)